MIGSVLNVEHLKKDSNLQPNIERGHNEDRV